MRMLLLIRESRRGGDEQHVRESGAGAGDCESGTRMS
jgi:hypothetical protein